MINVYKTAGYFRLSVAFFIFAAGLTACSGNLDQELVQAAKKGNTESVEYALGKGANVNAKDPEFHATALMWAAHEGRLDTMRILIQHGAEIDMRGDDGETALWFTAQRGQLEAMKLLVENGADPAVVGRDGQSAYTVAVTKGNTEIVDYLESLGISE